MNHAEPKKPNKRRPTNKANMDAPQEEFIAPKSVPSRPVDQEDREHGDEVEGAKARNSDAGHTHSGH